MTKSIHENGLKAATKKLADVIKAIKEGGGDPTKIVWPKMNGK